jgi:hypothetical protein
LKKSTIKDFSKNEEVLKNFVGDFFGISLEWAFWKQVKKS